MWLSHTCDIVTLTVLWIRKRRLGEYTCPQPQNCRPDQWRGGSIKYDEGDAGPSISLLIRKILSVNFLF